MSNRRTFLTALASAAGMASVPAVVRAQTPREVVLTNVSYDPTRELYRALNDAFAGDWKARPARRSRSAPSHGGSGTQARAVIDGLEADVVTLALAGDIDAIAREVQAPAGRLADAPAQQLRALHLDHRVPGAQGQSEGHQGLGRPRQARRRGHHAQSRRPRAARAGTISPPGPTGSTSTKRRRGRRRAKFVAALYKNVPVLDTGARGSTTTFAQRGIGDVLIAWENEAFLALQEFGADKFEIVVPSLLDPGRAAGRAGRRRSSTSTARARSPRPISTSSTRRPAQKIIAKNFYRPLKPEVADPADLARFPKLELVTIDEAFGGWAKAQADALRRRRHLRPDLQAGEAVTR